MDNSEPISMNEENPSTGDVQKCSRCGNSHEITFKAFKNKPPGYDYWSMCPILNEPILIKVTSRDPDLS